MLSDYHKQQISCHKQLFTTKRQIASTLAVEQYYVVFKIFLSVFKKQIFFLKANVLSQCLSQHRLTYCRLIMKLPKSISNDIR